MNSTITFLAAAALAGASALAQPYSIDWHSIAPGGSSQGGGYSLIGGMATEGAAEMSGGGFTLAGGYSIDPGGIEPAKIIFDSIGPNGNGLQFANPTFWIATKFCLGATPYSLHSITIPLDTRHPTVPPVVRLNIYTDAPGPSKPLADSGVLMNLSGATNPIEFTFAASSYQPVELIAYRRATGYLHRGGVSD